MTTTMYDLYNVNPPGGYSDDQDFDRAEEELKLEGWADWVVDSAIEEAMMRKKGMEI